MKPFSRIFLLSGAVLLMGASCIQFKSGGSGKALDGGVWKTADRGENWAQRAIVPTPKGLTTMGATNLVTLTMDPQDRQAIYAGTEENGLYYSYNGGDGWTQAVGVAGRVSAVVVDAKDKCTIHAAAGNRILRSTDCNRTWQGTYFESRAQQFVTTIAMDPKNSSILYAGISTGDLLRSSDGGGSWATLYRFENRIVDIAINRADNRIIYIGTSDAGIFRSGDGGASWTDYRRAWQPFFGARQVYAIELDPGSPDGVVVATRYGLIRTTDGGANWTPIQLLTQPGGVTITALAVDPQNARNLYYATAATLYKSADGGATWVTRKNPSSRIPRALLIDPQDGNVLYLGVAAVKK